MSPSPAAAGPETGQAQIVVHGLSKQFMVGPHIISALDNVSLRIEKGQFCCLVGPSGCGKTTLLRIVAGLETHTEGRLEINHFDSRKPLNSMVFQEQSIFPWMTVSDNVGYGLRMRGVRTTERLETVS